MTQIVAVIQARLGSSRLPGKALASIAGKPLFQHLVERMRTCVTLDDLVLATTHESSDAPLVECAEGLGVRTFAGSVEDVLDRMFRAAAEANADIVVRVTGDDPLKDPSVTDMTVRRLRDEGADYASNTIAPTFPEGVDIEVVTMAALELAWRKARLKSEREHVTPFIWKQPELFRLVSVTHSTDLSGLRWTVDYPADLAFVRAVYDELYHGVVFGMADVLDLLARRPELSRLNSDIRRNAGYEQSLTVDRPVD